MIFPSIDYSGSGANRIDITEIEEKANTLHKVGHHLLGSDLAGYFLLLDDLRKDAARTLGNRVCGISALFCYGTDDMDATNLEAVDNYGASFVGEYCAIVTIVDPEDKLTLETSGHSKPLVPSVVFSPFTGDDLPPFVLDEYSGLVSELYPFVAVPLVGMAVVVEKLPLYGY